MINILDELRSMIKMQGGSPEGINDIGMAVVTLKKLMISKRSFPGHSSENKQEYRQENRSEYKSRKESRNEEA